MDSFKQKKTGCDTSPGYTLVTEKSNLPIHFISHFRIYSRKCALSWELNLRKRERIWERFLPAVSGSKIRPFSSSSCNISKNPFGSDYVLYLLFKVLTLSLSKLIKLYQSNLTYIIEVLFWEETPFFSSIKQS